MSRNCRRWIASCIAVLLLAATPGDLLAEVAAEGGGPSTYVLVVGIIEGPDPIPQIIWEPVRDVDPLRVLNAAGANRNNEGRPDAAFNPVTGRPVVVWAYDTGSDHDIAIAEWLGTHWDTTRFLTSSSADQVDPRIFIASDGTIDVVWWVQGTSPTMVHVRRPAGSNAFGAEEVLTPPGAAGRRPSLVVWAGQTLLAYERNGGAGQEIVLARRAANGSWTTEVLATTTRLAAIDAVLHAAAGQLWIDWKHASNVMAYRRWTGTSWTSQATVPWSDPTWFGEMDARAAVQDLVLGN